MEGGGAHHYMLLPAGTPGPLAENSETMLGMTSVIVLYVLRFRHTRKITPIVFWVAVLMFMFSTTHVSLGFYRLIRGFIDLRDMPGGPGAYFSDVSTPPNVAKVTIHSVNSILGDSIVVRCPCRLPVCQINSALTWSQ